MVKNLILVLGDQLSHGLASLREGDPDTDIVVMGELMDEASYVNHHRKKLVFIFSAMRHFAKELEQEGWTVDYRRLDAKGSNKPTSFTDLISAAIKKHKPERLVLVEPGEWRVLQEVDAWEGQLGIDVDLIEDDRFIASRDEFSQWAEGKKALRMEFFYREMRRKTNLLMDGNDPVGGKWNYDAENRKSPPKDLETPPPFEIEPDEITKDVIAMVQSKFPDGFGTIDPFWFAVTHDDAQKCVDRFVDECLPIFGDYQDAMIADNRFMAHSLLSFYINAGLLDPLDVCIQVEKAYTDGRAPLNAVEGFIRQIIGWREYIRGIYWREGPDYTKRNELNADIPLPEFFWSGETDMRCMAQTISQTRDEAYAHHIQRLMVTGTFSLIAGLDPHAVHEWYLSVYADAYEWVESPNVIGMSLFADGGIVASKPYAASGAYINRMSDYCSGCTYNVAKKTEDDACPFNALYWDFLIRNDNKLRSNPRIGRVYATWDRMKDGTKSAYLDRAQTIITALRNGDRV